MTGKPSENDLHLRFWLITFAVTGLILWALAGALLPFILGLAIAYFLDPVVRRMNTAGLPRSLCALLVLLVFISILAGATILLAPIVRVQVADLITSMPEYIRTLEGQVWPFIADVLKHFPSVETDKLQANLAQHSGEAITFVGRVLQQVVSGGLAILDILALFVLTPIIAFYLMRDFPKIVATVDGLLPIKQAPVIRQELRSVNQMIAGFVRGQAMVSLSLATFYSVGLSLVGLKYGIIIGLAAGLLSFIPIVGTVTGVVSSLVMAFIQFDSAGSIAAVAAVFMLAQMLDGYFLTPKLVGDSVGLHPVWIMFAVLAGGKLFGFVGVLLGVPVAGTLAILLRFAIQQYRKSRYYSPMQGPAR
jgi:predicted PurR-regulated permease PerM